MAVSGMDVDVHVQGRPKPLDDRDGPTASVRHTVLAGTAPQESKHDAHEHPDHCSAERMIPREQIPNPMRKGEHPLAHGDKREDVIHQMRRALGHSPAAAAWTEGPSLTREGDQTIETAAGTLKTGEPPGEPPAAQKSLELLLDERGQAVALPSARGVGAKGMVVIAHDLIEHALSRRAGFVPRGWSDHVPP